MESGIFLGDDIDELARAIEEQLVAVGGEGDRERDLELGEVFDCAGGFGGVAERERGIWTGGEVESVDLEHHVVGGCGELFEGWVMDPGGEGSDRDGEWMDLLLERVDPGGVVGEFGCGAIEIEVKAGERVCWAGVVDDFAGEAGELEERAFGGGVGAFEGVDPEGEAELGVCGDASPGDIDCGAGVFLGGEVDFACEEDEFIKLRRESFGRLQDFGGPGALPNVGLMGQGAGGAGSVGLGRGAGA